MKNRFNMVGKENGNDETQVLPATHEVKIKSND